MLLTKDVLITYLRDLEIIQNKYNTSLPKNYNDYPTFDIIMHNFYEHLIECTKEDICRIDSKLKDKDVK